MADYKKVIEALEYCTSQSGCWEDNSECPWVIECEKNSSSLKLEAIELLKALRLLVEWAEECDFGYDQFPDEYELYKDEIQDMGYIDGMIYVARRTLEDHGEFENGRH